MVHFRFFAGLFLGIVLGGMVLTAAEPARLALLVGNAAYDAPATLKNPANDANDMAAALRKSGWELTVVTDADRRTFTRAIAAFRDALSAKDGAQALFYYAGHGMQVDNVNYLIPVKTAFDTIDDIKADAISLQTLTDAVKQANASVSVVILDACRDNPFAKKMARSLGGTRGLTVVSGAGGASGSAILFSTSPGDVAQDGAGRNGVFTSALLNYVASDLKIEELFKKVTGDVRRLSGGAQNPWINASLSSDFYFISDARRAALALEAETAAKEAQKAAVAAATRTAQSEAEAARKAAAEAMAAQAKVEAKMAAEQNRPRGKARIESYESGEIFLGGELLGEVGPDSPLMSDSLATGTQEFRLVRKGLPDIRKSATIGDKAYVTVTFGTAPLQATGAYPGSLSVAVNIDGAKATLDENDSVVLPHVFEGLIPGEHTLVIHDVMVNGQIFAGSEQKVTVMAGKQIKLRPELSVAMAKIRLEGFPSDVAATIVLESGRRGLELVPAGEGKLLLDAQITAGEGTLELTSKNVTWTRSYYVQPNQTQYISPSQAHKQIVLQRKTVRLSGKDDDFAGIDPLFIQPANLKPGPFKGFNVASATMCRDETSLYIKISYQDGRPEPARTSFRFVELLQGDLHYNLGAGPWDDGSMHTNYWNAKTNTGTDGGSVVIGKDFIEMRFFLSPIGKTIFNPKGFDWTQPMLVKFSTWLDSKKLWDGTEWVEVIFGP